LAECQTISGLALLIPPFGASCVLVFLLPDSPLAQPRNVVGGHLLSATMGLLALATLGRTPPAEAVGVAAAILAMSPTRTVHPLAGANPLIVVATAAGWHFLLTPVLVGALVIVAMERLSQLKAWPWNKSMPKDSITRGP
jgi:CBS-domain-containing membrane protein